MLLRKSSKSRTKFLLKAKVVAKHCTVRSIVASDDIEMWMIGLIRSGNSVEVVMFFEGTIVSK